MQIHDSIIEAYNVNLNDKKINLFIKVDKEENNICFSEVFAHYFENELFGSVILDIRKNNLQEFFVQNGSLLNERKNNCWPIDYNDNDELKNIIENAGYSYYVISSSYGMRGWIIAKNCNCC